uniref:Uncharacterized protein n=1 Tax=Neobodo designis TaxID=312471 RepID=A0A7S1VYZ1_NEODS
MGCCGSNDRPSDSDAAEALRRSITDLAQAKVPTFDWRFRDGHGGSKLRLAGSRCVRRGLEERAGRDACPIALELLDMEIGDDGAAEIARGLRSEGLLVSSLNLSSNGITGKGAAALGEGLHPGLRLQRLVVGRNAIDGEGVAALLKPLNTCAALEFLEVPLGSALQQPPITVEHESGETLGELARSGVKGISIRIWGVPPNGDVVAAVLDGMGSSDRAQEFRCTGTKACVGTLGGLKCFTKAAQTLNVLELRHVDVARDAVAAMCEALSCPRAAITEMTLFACGLDDGACTCIGRMLAKNKSLVTLDVGGNDSITSEGLCVMFDGLRHNRRLRTLNLADLAFNDGTAEVLARNLDDPSAAPLTNVRHNPIQSPSLAQRLLDILNRNECRQDETSSASSLGVAVAHSPATGEDRGVVAGADDSFELVV